MMRLAALCVFLTAACGWDYKEKRIPNKLIIWMAVCGTVRRLWGEGSQGALSYLGQAVFIMAILYPFFRIGGLGAGDVKLLGMTAGYLPAGKILAFLLCSLLIAAVISLIKIRKRERFAKRSAHAADKVCLSGPVLVSVLLYLGGVY